MLMWKWIICGMGASLATHSALAASSVDLQTFRTHSRLSIQLDPSVEPSWTETPGGFKLLLKGVALQDLYLSPGVVDSLRDSRLKSVSVAEAGDSVVLTGVWNFPAGDAAPADPSMERFQYREKAPAKLLIDFWPKTGPTVGDLKKLKETKSRQAAIKTAEREALARRQRRAEVEKSLAIQADVARFCTEPMKDGVDIFLPFYPLHETFDFAKYFPDTNPDESFQFLIPKEGTEDAKYVKLALDLHRKGNHALAIKTLDLFEKEQPKSIYLTDMRFLRANALRKLGLKDAANRLFEELRERSVGTPASLFSALYLANQVRLEGNHLQTLERYLWISQNYPEHRLNWVFRMAAAEALYSLKQSDRAIKEYEWIAENGPDAESRANGLIRIGNAYLVRFQYDRALASYFKAMETFPEITKNSASLQLNRAESLYWLGQLDRAESAFGEFRSRFSAHPAGWRASIRLGEIVGRKPGPEAIAASRKHFLQAVNGYPFSAGATLARMRLIPCGDHAGFTAEAARAFFEKDAQTYTGEGEIDMDRYKELRAMLRVRSLVLYDELVAAIDAAIQEKEELSRKSQAALWIGDMERQLFRKTIITLLDAGKKFDAIQFYDKRADKLSLVDDAEEIDSTKLAIDPDYLLRLSRAASDLNLGTLATKIYAKYVTASAQFALSRGIASSRGKDDLDAKLRASEKAFTEAKALWVVDHVKETAKIRDRLVSVIDESPFSFQKEIMLGILAEQDGKLVTAIGHASKAKLLLPPIAKASGSEIAVIDQWIAKLQVASNNTRAAIETFRKLQAAPTGEAAEIGTGLGLKPLEGKESWIISEGELLTKLGRFGEAALAFEKAVNEGMGGNRAMYEYANALSKSSRDPGKVRDLLQKVAESEKNDFWKELARKALAGVNAKEGN